MGHLLGRLPRRVQRGPSFEKKTDEMPENFSRTDVPFAVMAVSARMRRR